MEQKKVNVQMLEPQPTNGIRTIDTTSAKLLPNPLLYAAFYILTISSCMIMPHKKNISPCQKIALQISKTYKSMGMKDSAKHWMVVSKQTPCYINYK